MVTGAPARNLSNRTPILRRDSCSVGVPFDVPLGVPLEFMADELGRGCPRSLARVLMTVGPNENVRIKITRSVTSKARLAHARLIISQLSIPYPGSFDS